MIYFASDFHLGVPDDNKSRIREKHLCSWLNEIAQDATEVYLLGDVLDFWFEYKHAVPKGYSRLFATLAGLTDQGIDVYWFKGNHDMWTFGYLEWACGVKVIDNELRIARGGKNFYLHHGDGLGRGDRRYKLLRKVFRSKACQWLFARIHPNLGISIASYLSRKSRKSQGLGALAYQGNSKELLTQFCEEYLQQEPIDFFIFGHRHLLLDIDLSNGARYINLGDWFQEMPYARFDGIKLEIKKYSPDPK